MLCSTRIAFLRTLYLIMSHSDPRGKSYCCWIFHFFSNGLIVFFLEQVSRWWSESCPGFHQGSQHDHRGRWSCQSDETAVWEWRRKDGEGKSLQIEGSSHPGSGSRGLLCQEFGAVCGWNYVVHEMSEMCILTSVGAMMRVTSLCKLWRDYYHDVYPMSPL